MDRRMFPGTDGFWSMPAQSNVQTLAEASPLRPSYPAAPEPTSSPSFHLLIGLAVLLLVLYMFNRHSCDRIVHRQVPRFVNGMRAAVTGALGHVVKGTGDVAGGLANGEDHHIKVALDLIETSAVENLTKCTSDVCKDFRNMETEQKAENDKCVEEFCKKHDKAMLMIYAPWCPHCHTAMPEFYKASKDAKIPFGLINAELVNPHLLQGENALFNVQYFPYILRREKHGNEASDTLFKDVPSADNLKKHCEMTKMDYLFA
jgi:thiol-disulfide isomerase/thioredoxin